jgi:hypothetical protein
MDSTLLFEIEKETNEYYTVKICMVTEFFFSVLELEYRVYTLSHSISPFL